MSDFHPICYQKQRENRLTQKPTAGYNSEAISSLPTGLIPTFSVIHE